MPWKCKSRWNTIQRLHKQIPLDRSCQSAPSLPQQPSALRFGPSWLHCLMSWLERSRRSPLLPCKGHESLGTPLPWLADADALSNAITRSNRFTTRVSAVIPFFQTGFMWQDRPKHHDKPEMAGADELADGTDALTEGSLCQRQNGPSGKSFPEGVAPKISPVRRSRLMSVACLDSWYLQPNHLQTPSLNVAGLVSS